MLAGHLEDGLFKNRVYRNELFDKLVLFITFVHRSLQRSGVILLFYFFCYFDEEPGNVKWRRGISGV